MFVVSGIQPTGNLHLGNYLGAIRQWVAMQDAMAAGDTCLFFLADLHALTQAVVPAELAANTLEMAATLIACGVDPERAILFNQARVPEHSELAWLLGGTARVGWLNRMTQWKDKAGKNREGQSVGLPTCCSIEGPTYRSATTRNSIWNWRATSRPSSTPISA
jgi:tryptophanyl-tRNA synthetase